jgi:hypothetical protein
MKEPHEKRVAICSAPSFALGAAKRPVKRKQGKRWAGYRASKICNQGADAVTTAEGNMTGSVNASCWAALRSRRPQCTSGDSMHENRETSEMPEANLRDRSAGEGKSRTARMQSSRSRTAEQYR